MEDAMVLAQCLRDIEDPGRAFQTFERRRRPRVDAIFEQARRNGSGKAVGGRLAEWFRDRLLPIFLQFGASAQSKSYGFRIAWEQPTG
jgi:FAD-dependent urate hydroxylase